MGRGRVCACREMTPRALGCQSTQRVGIADSRARERYVLAPPLPLLAELPGSSMSGSIVGVGFPSRAGSVGPSEFSFFERLGRALSRPREESNLAPVLPSPFVRCDARSNHRAVTIRGSCVSSPVQLSGNGRRRPGSHKAYKGACGLDSVTRTLCDVGYPAHSSCGPVGACRYRTVRPMERRVRAVTRNDDRRAGYEKAPHR